jgi:hypothetical protein
MDAQDEQRAAMNEATFRTINEGMSSDESSDTSLSTFVCECGRLGCNKLLELTRAEYEAIRANPRRFAVLGGHELPEVERVIARNERFFVVEKTGDPEAEIVERTDPRRPLD